MMPPPIAAKRPSLRLATRHTGPPRMEAIVTAQNIGITSIFDSSSISSSSTTTCFFFLFFLFFLTGSSPGPESRDSNLEDLMLAPIRDSEQEPLAVASAGNFEDLNESHSQIFKAESIPSFV